MFVSDGSARQPCVPFERLRVPCLRRRAGIESGDQFAARLLRQSAMRRPNIHKLLAAGQMGRQCLHRGDRRGMCNNLAYGGQARLSFGCGGLTELRIDFRGHPGGDVRGCGNASRAASSKDIRKLCVRSRIYLESI